jgi:hypothetical protein
MSKVSPAAPAERSSWSKVQSFVLGSDWSSTLVSMISFYIFARQWKHFNSFRKHKDFSFDTWIEALGSWFLPYLYIPVSLANWPKGAVLFPDIYAQDDLLS